MKYIGLKAGGAEISLPSPVSAYYNSASDAPADVFRCVFPLSGACGTLTGLRVEDASGGIFFLGIVDIQRVIVSGEKSVLNLTCRSLAGLLLDSEAVPQTYELPDLATIFTRHVRPYGFTGFLGKTCSFRGPMRVTKGMSEWQAAALFCKTYFHTVPRVNGSIFDATGGSAGRALLLDNSSGTRYSCAELRNRSCDRISELYQLSAATGTYVPAAKDAETAALGIVRRRCLTKASDCAALLKAADRRAFAVIADCPGLPQTAVGASAELRNPSFGSFSGLAVSEITCELGSGGITTKYLLRRN